MSQANPARNKKKIKIQNDFFSIFLFLQKQKQKQTKEVANVILAAIVAL